MGGYGCSGACCGDSDEVSEVELALEVQRLRVSLGQLQTSFDALMAMKEQAEGERDGLARAIRGIAETLIPERLAEMAREDSAQLGRMTAAEMARLVQVEGASKMYRLQAAQERPDAGRQTWLEQRLLEMEAALTTLRARERALEEALAESRARLRTAEERLAAWVAAKEDRAAPVVGTEGEERADVLLGVLATTGISRRKELERILREEHGVPEGGSMHRLFERVSEAGWVVRLRPKAEARGRNTELVRLTEVGRERVREVLGVEAVRSEWERLAERHGSDAHVLLTLEGADHLRRFGATAVDVFPVPARTADGGTFAPDIVAVLEEHPIYVECERRTRKDPAARDRKWANVYQATSEFCIICPDEGACKAIVSEVTGWAMERGKAVRLRVASLDRGERLWVLERDIAARKEEDRR
ncbi:MAG: hypothetical protein H5T65_05690 [Chloroflexi bacterium]|nr:hypothetical protein [Chloroflexota bacterium]